MPLNPPAALVFRLLHRETVRAATFKNETARQAGRGVRACTAFDFG